MKYLRLFESLKDIDKICRTVLYKRLYYKSQMVLLMLMRVLI